MKPVGKLIKWLIFAFLIFAGSLGIYFYVKIHQPLSTQGSEQVFEIPPGWTTRQVASKLVEEGIIAKAIFFEGYVFFKSQGSRIQAGNYLVSSTLSIREILDKFIKGDVMDDSIRFTVLEGWSERNIADALQNLGLTTRQSFLSATNLGLTEGGVRKYNEFSFVGEIPQGHSVEGFLFPDTYAVKPKASSEDLVRLMLRNFERKLTEEMREGIEKKNRSLYDVVILASIIEREVGRNVKPGTKLDRAELEKIQQERRTVSSVFQNRLAIGMALESDATVTYITGRNSARATVDETRIDSPYNTYKYRGLPPGPISNPSLDSLVAAIYPAKTDFLFFLTSPDGTAYFGRTHSEHLQNRERYLE